MIDSLKRLGRSFKKELKVYQLVLRDPQTPRAARVLLGLAVGYMLLPFDLVPDFIPVLGQLDDVLIVPGLIWLALKFIPTDVLERCHRQAASETGTSR